MYRCVGSLWTLLLSFTLSIRGGRIRFGSCASLLVLFLIPVPVPELEKSVFIRSFDNVNAILAA